jgi:hypothetical protein
MTTNFLLMFGKHWVGGLGGASRRRCRSRLHFAYLGSTVKG